MRADTANDQAQVSATSIDGGVTATGTLSNTTNGSWVRFTASGTATNSKTYVPDFGVDGDYTAGGDIYYFDDMIIYTTTLSSGADITKPNAPTALTSSRSGSNNALSWTDGTDNATNTSGIDGTLILRVTGDKTGSITNISNALLNQAYYATVSTTGPTTISDGTNTWTVISNGSSSATYTDASSTDVTYAVFMRDKAYNYSSGVATYVPNAPTVTASGGVVASSPGSGTSGYVGNTITINGTNLGAVNVVKVGGSGGTSVTITSQTATTLTFVAINVGGTIYVQNQGGNATSTESYTNLGYISNAATDWNTTTTWLGSAVPVAGSTVTINHAVTVNSTATNVPSSVTINSTKSLTFGASGSLTATTVTNNGSVVMTDGGTLNIAAGGTLANGTSTFTRGSGKVSFAGTGTISGTIIFNDVDIAGGINFGSASTINGTLTINAGGFVSTNAPSYGASSLLKYNTASIASAAYGRGLEWSATSGAGYPNNVQLSNNTFFDLGNNGTATARQIAGSLTIDAGSGFFMDFSSNTMSQPLTVLGSVTNNGSLSLSSTSGGGLKVGGDFANNGTFNPYTRTVEFLGSTAQIISGSLNGVSTTNNFAYLTISNTSGGVSLSTPVVVTNTLNLNTGVVTTTSTNILHITNTAAAAMVNGSSASYVSGPLRWSVSNSGGGNYKFHLGKSSTYLPLNVNNPTGTSPVITAEAFAANAGGSAGSGLSSISTSEYWSVVNTGTLSAATISLAKASIGSNDGIGSSTTLAGTYTNLGGSVTSTLITSNTVTAGTTVGSLATTTYFLLGVKVAVPTITSFTPSSGYVGTTITITGTDFTGASAVTIGGIAVASYTVNSATSISATVAAGGATGTIAVTTPGGTATSASTFTFGGYISAAATDWNTASTWLGGAVPPAGATVTIDHAVTLNGTVNAAPATIIVNASKSLTFGASGALTATTVTNNGSIVMTAGGTLTIATGGTLANGSNTFTGGTGKVAFAGTGTVSGTIGFNDVTLAGGVNFGIASTINGTLTINAGGFVNTNAPTYASSSTLLYNSGSSYGRGTEWSATSGAGYPSNVQISNSTTLSLGANSGTGTARQLAGNLTVDELSTLTLNATSEVMTQAITVKGNYINNGTTILSGSIGGDLVLEGNLTDNNIFTANGRAIFFRGSNTQSITSSTNPLDIDVMRVEKSGGEILLLQNLLVDETADPIQFAGTSSVLNLNGYTATFGKSGTTSAITMNSTSSIKGSSTSSLAIYGNGAFGTIRFDQTSPGTTNVLQNLTIDRITSGSVTLGNNLIVGGTLALTNGSLVVGGNTFTYSGSSITRTTGVIDASNNAATVVFSNASLITPVFTNNVNNLTINGGGITLGSATTVAGTLTLTAGDIITTTTNKLTLTSTSTLSGGSASSYIEGPLDRTLANGSSFTYPIGSSTSYRPIILQSVVATGSPVVRVTMAETGATTVDNGATISALLSARNWNITTVSGTFTSATLNITEDGLVNGTSTIVKASTNQAGTYSSLGSSTVSGGTITSPSGQVAGFYAIGTLCTNPTSGGTVAGGETICSGGDPAAFTSSAAASGNVGTLEYKWQYSSTSDFSSDINDITSSNSTTYDPPLGLSATRYYRRLSRVSCKSDWTGAAASNILTVTVRSSFTAGAINTSGEAICFGGTPTEIGSTTSASGGDGSITYSWRSSADSYTAAISGATSATYTPPSGLTATTSYRRYANDGTCNTTATASTGTWTVTVNPVISGNTSGSATSICNNSTATLTGGSTTGGSGSYTYLWESSADGLTGWSNAAGTNTGANYTTATLTTSSTQVYFRRTTFSGGCTDVASGVLVTVTTAPNAGTLSGTQAICSNGSTTFSSNGNAGGAFTSGSTGVATVNSSSGAITPVAAGTSTITYTVTGTGGCSNATATRTVTVTTAPNAGTLSGTNAICSTGSTTFTSNGDSGGTFTSATPAAATVVGAT
ncbi:MAG: hypothetical protein EBW87_01610, partial [Burkholderiaceae bacterium]|nr:hypothetical protein [Burkholderiaceae bacterium]